MRAPETVVNGSSSAKVPSPPSSGALSFSNGAGAGAGGGWAGAGGWGRDTLAGQPSPSARAAGASKHVSRFRKAEGTDRGRGLNGVALSRSG